MSIAKNELWLAEQSRSFVSRTTEAELPPNRHIHYLHATKNKDYSITKTLSSVNVAYEFFPNPTHGILHLKLSELLGEPVTIEIMDITGKMILLQSFHEKGIYDLDISNAPNGVFIMRIFNNQFFQSNKIIKL